MVFQFAPSSTWTIDDGHDSCHIVLKLKGRKGHANEKSAHCLLWRVGGVRIGSTGEGHLTTETVVVIGRGAWLFPLAPYGER